MHNKCEHCIFGDVCPSKDLCEYYTPMRDVDYSDEFDDDEEWAQYYEDWYKYIKEFN